MMIKLDFGGESINLEIPDHHRPPQIIEFDGAYFDLVRLEWDGAAVYRRAKCYRATEDQVVPPGAYQEMVGKVFSPTPGLKEMVTQTISDSLAKSRARTDLSVSKPEKESTSGRILDPDGPSPDPELDEKGMHRGYWVLSAEERAKGFVRPVRRSYKHVGPKGPKYPLRDLTPEERERYGNPAYVKFEEYPESESPVLGRCWTQEQLDMVDMGCGTVTSMGQAISETWARNQNFYSATYCAGCQQHLPVEEFIWPQDGERLGS